MKPLSKRHLVRISSRQHNDLIEDMRNRAKEIPEVVDKFKEYGVSLDNIDNVFISFCPLEVSAKTKDQKIYLNEAMLLEDSDVGDPIHYLVHELVHYLQQHTGKNLDKHYTEDNYLDKKTEEEAFKAQVKYKKREESEEDAKTYVENLLNHHGLKGKKRIEKKKELLGK